MHCKAKGKVKKSSFVVRCFSSYVRKQHGQLLIEALVAISVISIAILGIFALSSRSIGQQEIVKNQYIATYLAAEGIEVIKNIIDSNVVKDCEGWNTGLGTGGDYSVDYLTDGSEALPPDQGKKLYFDDGIYSNIASDEESKFHRVVNIDYADNRQSMNVKSTVEWKDRAGAEFEIVVEDVFYNWRPSSDRCI